MLTNDHLILPHALVFIYYAGLQSMGEKKKKKWGVEATGHFVEGGGELNGHRHTAASVLPSARAGARIIIAKLWAPGGGVRRAPTINYVRVASCRQ